MIGKQTQYFLAESTKTLDLLDSQNSEQEDDGLWIGCSQVGKEGRLCEVRLVGIFNLVGSQLILVENDRASTYSWRISLLYRNRSFPGQSVQSVALCDWAAIFQVLCWYAVDIH